MLARAVIKCSIWLIGIIVALLPVLHAGHLRPTINLWRVAVAANDAGLFRDMFFIVIVITVASFCNVLDNVVKRSLRIPRTNKVKVGARLPHALRLFAK